MSASGGDKFNKPFSSKPTTANDPARLNLLFDALLYVAGSEDTDELIHGLASRLCWVLDFDRCCVGLTEVDGSISFYASPVNTAQDAAPVSTTEKEALSEVVRDGTVLRLDLSDPAETALCLPLTAGERKVGALLFASKRTDGFDHSDLRFAQAISTYVAVALDRLHQLEALAHSNTELQFAHIASLGSLELEADKSAIVRESGDELEGIESFDASLALWAQQIRIVIGAHQSAVSYIPHGVFAEGKHAVSLSEKYEKYKTYDVLPTGEGIWRLVASEKLSFCLTDEELQAHPAWKDFSGLRDDRGLEHPPMRGWLAVPVLSQDRDFVGALQLSDKHKGDFTQGDLKLLKRLAQLIAPAFSLQYANEEIQRHSKQLAREQYLLNSLVDSIPDPVFFKDEQGKFIRANRAMAQNAGLDDPSQLIGKTDADIWSGSLPQETRTDEQKIMETGEPIINKEEQPILAGGRERWVSVTKMPLRDEDGKIVGILGSARDITKLKQHELALEQSNIQLQQFAYIASHDLQAPLRGINGFARFLQEEYQGRINAKADEYIGFIISSANRMQQLIDDLLTYSRVEAQSRPFQPTDLRKAFDDAVALLRASIQDAAAQVTRDELPTVMGDPSQLSQLLQNLIGNALKYHGDDPPRVHVSAERSENEWTISVRDNGIGIHPKYYDRIFEILRRLHSEDKYPGTGIGLAVCRRIVLRHGGRIWLESEIGKGSTFSFSIPMRDIEERHSV